MKTGKGGKVGGGVYFGAPTDTQENGCWSKSKC